MVIESECRKECFDERNSAPVRLADGQTWFLPKPWLEVRPVFRGGRTHSSYPVLTYGRELDALIEAIGDCEDGAARICAVASLGAHLVTRQYQLTDEELDLLFCFRAADDVSSTWLRTVIEVATGRSGPKVSSAGGD
jgi:hypothetical protein